MAGAAFRDPLGVVEDAELNRVEPELSRDLIDGDLERSARRLAGASGRTRGE
jgi:hypothetical protein